MTAVTNHINQFSNLSFSFENMHKRTTLIGFLPLQANASFDKDENGVERYWFQLLGNFKSSYNRTDENGEQHDDNASVKTLTVKFPMSYLAKHGVTSSQIKKYFDDNYVGKKFIFLPVTEEKQKFEFHDKKRVPVKNVSECSIDDSFNLRDLLGSTDVAPEFFNDKDKPVGAKKP